MRDLSREAMFVVASLSEEYPNLPIPIVQEQRTCASRGSFHPYPWRGESSGTASRCYNTLTLPLIATSPV